MHGFLCLGEKNISQFIPSHHPLMSSFPQSTYTAIDRGQPVKPRAASHGSMPKIGLSH